MICERIANIGQAEEMDVISEEDSERVVEEVIANRAGAFMAATVGFECFTPVFVVVAPPLSVRTL